MRSENLLDDRLGAHRGHFQPFFVAPNFAEGDHVKVLRSHAYGYHAAQVFLVRGLGEHILVHAAVEAAKLEQHSWQAAKLRSVGGALVGLRRAAAALRFQLPSFREGSTHCSREVCWPGLRA